MSEIKTPVWEECKELVKTINPHYGLREIDQRQLFELIKDSREGAVFVEVGVCHGRTAVLLAYVAKCVKGEYHGIDLWGFDGSTKDAVEAALMNLDLQGHLYQGSSNKYLGLPLACPLWDKPIDVLFIDGGHDESNVRGDCEAWLPHLVPEGLVAFDDWNEDGAPYSNAHWAINYYSSIYCADWEVMNTGKLHCRRKRFIAREGGSRE